MLHVSYCSKSRTNAISSFQFLEPTDEEESNTKTTSICACGGQGPSNIFMPVICPRISTVTSRRTKSQKWNETNALCLASYLIPVMANLLWTECLNSNRELTYVFQSTNTAI